MKEAKLNHGVGYVIEPEPIDKAFSVVDKRDNAEIASGLPTDKQSQMYFDNGNALVPVVSDAVTKAMSKALDEVKDDATDEGEDEVVDKSFTLDVGDEAYIPELNVRGVVEHIADGLVTVKSGTRLHEVELSDVMPML